MRRRRWAWTGFVAGALVAAVGGLSAAAGAGESMGVLAALGLCLLLMSMWLVDHPRRRAGQGLGPVAGTHQAETR
jgi:hypothetical protein